MRNIFAASVLALATVSGGAAQEAGNLPVVVRRAPLPRPIACVMALAAVAYLMQGWLAGAAGFSPAHTIAIVAAEVLNAVWMAWLLMVTSET